MTYSSDSAMLWIAAETLSVDDIRPAIKRRRLEEGYHGHSNASKMERVVTPEHSATDDTVHVVHQQKQEHDVADGT
jgi:hypothetical protein